MSNEISSLTISLQYVDDDCGSWTLQDLCRNQGVLNPAHMDNSGFHQALGGLRLFKDRIFCFLNTDGRTDLFSSAWFLLHSLAVLRGHAAEGPLPGLFPPAEDSQVVAQLDHEDVSCLRLCWAGDHLVLSFLDSEGRCPAERLSPYFEQLAIARAAWIESAAEALEEYAVLARRVAGPHPDPQAGPGRLLSLWSRLNSRLAGR